MSDPLYDEEVLVLFQAWIGKYSSQNNGFSHTNRYTNVFLSRPPYDSSIIFQGIMYQLCYCASLFFIQVANFHPSKPHTPVRHSLLMYFCCAPRHQCEDFYPIKNLIPLALYNFVPCSPCSISFTLPIHSSCFCEYGRSFSCSTTLFHYPDPYLFGPFFCPIFLYCYSSPLPLTARL